VGHRRNEPAFLFPDLEDLHHERNIILFFEPLANMLPQYRGCEGAEAFPPLNLAIQNIPHVGATTDGAVPADEVKAV
jgi:hypothetical protein